jgi:hypothetical protein
MARFVAVLSSHAAARLHEDGGWGISGLPCATGKPIEVTFRSRYIDLGFESKLPGRLVAEVAGEATDLTEALSAFSQSVNLISPVMAVSVNASVPAFEFDLAYDNTVGSETHAFTQWFRQSEDPDVLPNQRPINPHLIAEVMQRLLHSQEGARAHRACVQYQEALGSWTAGAELTAVMHLWMAAEALTKAMLRRECLKAGIDEDALSARWGIAKKELDGEIRRRIIFAGDDNCYKTAKNTSDALEHMFEDFPKLQKQATSCRDCCASHVRRAVIDLLEITEPHRAQLARPPYDEPLALVALDRTIHGVIHGQGGQLAPSGSEHPRLENWRPNLRGLKATDKGYEIEMADDYQVAISPKAQLKVTGMGTGIPARDVQVVKTGEGTPSSSGS